MFSFRKISSPAVAALLITTLIPTWSLAKDAKVKAAPKAAVKAAPKGQAKDQAQPAASRSLLRVNGTAITRLEVDRAVKVMLAQNQIQEPLPEETMKQAESAALEQLTSAELLYQEASKLTIQDLDLRIAEKVAQNRAKFQTEAEFDEALKSIDMTLKDMQDFTRKDVVINNFIENQVAAKATVTETEARNFYDENLEQYFKKPESATASHILIGVDENASTEDRKKAKEKAEALLKRVKGGEDFAALAKSDSSCPSATQGGDLGTFGRGQMVPAFESATFALKPGETSDVVETKFGYHIIKLTDKQEAATEQFDGVKENISEFLKKEKIQREISSIIDELRKTAKIEKL